MEENMNPVQFHFPSTNANAVEFDNYGSCGCASVSNDPQENCNDFQKEQTKEPKIVSEIVESGQPYKEIEIVINDNRMMLRLQRVAITQKEEYEPPCECLSESSAEKNQSKSHENAEKTISTIPPAPSTNHNSLKAPKSEKFQCRAIDLADNPNMFLLKIRRRSETGDRRRENLDLEFRTPRPW